MDLAHLQLKAAVSGHLDHKNSVLVAIVTLSSSAFLVFLLVSTYSLINQYINQHTFAYILAHISIDKHRIKIFLAAFHMLLP